MSSPATIDLAEYPYVRLASGEYSVEISTYGGGLRVCEYGGKPLVESYPRGGCTTIELQCYFGTMDKPNRRRCL